MSRERADVAAWLPVMDAASVFVLVLNEFDHAFAREVRVGLNYARHVKADLAEPHSRGAA